MMVVGNQAGNKGEKEAIKTPAPDPAVLRLIRSQTTGVGWGDEDLAQPVQYVVGEAGLFLRKDSPLGTVQVKLAGSKGKIPLAPSLSEGLTTELVKIPFSVFSPAINFLLKVKEKFNTEGLVRFYYQRETQQWVAHVPEQVTTTASVVIREGVEEPSGEFLAEIHSHPGTSSVFSGTDDANEQRDQWFMCVAFDKNGKPNFHARIGTGLPIWLDTEIDTFVDLDANLSILAKIRTIITGGFPFLDFPAEWLDRVSKEPPVVHIVNRPNQPIQFPIYSHAKNPSLGPKTGELETFGRVRRLSEAERKQAEQNNETVEWLLEMHDAGHNIGLTRAEIEAMRD